jgi:hypothetical protein
MGVERQTEISPLCEGRRGVGCAGMGRDVTGERNAHTLWAVDSELAAVLGERRS